MKSLIPISAVVGATSVAVPVLTDSAMKSIAVIAAAIGLAALLRRASAATRHTVWLSAMIALLTLPLLSNSLPRWQVLPASMAWETETVVPVVDAVPTPLPAIDHGPVVEREAATLPITLVPNENTTPVVSRTAESVSVSSWLVFTWASVAGVLLMRLLIAHYSLRRQVRHLTGPDSDELRDQFELLKSDIGVSDNVQLLIGRDQEMPKTFGFLRPFVLLPSNASEWEPSRLHAVLAHELGHIKRRDPLAQLVVQIACALYWFNPLVWFGARLMESERERACDDLVLNNGFRASDYARHLLDVVTACDSSRLTACASVGMARRSRLEGRVVSILDSGVNRRSITRALLCLAAVGTFAAVIPLAMVGAQDGSADDEPSALESQPADPVPLPPRKPLNKAVSDPESSPVAPIKNPIDKVVVEKIRKEFPDMAKPVDPEQPLANRQKVIRDFYRFFLNRKPTDAELRTLQKSWTQEDYHRMAQQIEGANKLTRPSPPKPDLDALLPPRVNADPTAQKKVKHFERAYRTQTRVGGLFDAPNTAPSRSRSSYDPIAPPEATPSNAVPAKQPAVLAEPVGTTPPRAIASVSRSTSRQRINRVSRSKPTFAEDPVTREPATVEPSPAPIATAVPQAALPAARSTSRKPTTRNVMKPRPIDAVPTFDEPVSAARKVPVLGDVPVVGKAFTSTTRSAGTAAPQPIPHSPARPSDSTITASDDRVVSVKTSTGQTRWVTRAGAGKGFETPVVRGDRVYVTDKSDFIHCLDAKTGKLLWKCDDGDSMTRTDIERAYRDVLGKAPAKGSDGAKLLGEVQTALKARNWVGTAPTPFDDFAVKQITVAKKVEGGRFGTAVRNQRRELINHWTELVNARQKLRDSVKRQNQLGIATADNLNRAEQSLTEARIGLAKSQENHKSVRDELTRLVSLTQAQLKRQEALSKNGLLSDADLLKTREALLEAKIRLTEYQMNTRSSSTTTIR